MIAKLIRISAILLSWSSLLFLNKNTVKRYMPVALFAALMVAMVYEMAYKLRWWKLKNTVPSWNNVSDLSFLFGPFLVGTIWIFHFTSKANVYIYLLANALVDGFFAFLLMPVFEKLGLVKLENQNRTGIFSIMVTLAALIYPYHQWQAGVCKRKWF